MSIIEFIIGRRNTNRLRMSKSSSGDWNVKKGQSVLYIGTKEKCQTFLDFHMTA
jgi:acid phosphatase class B